MDEILRLESAEALREHARGELEEAQRRLDGIVACEGDEGLETVLRPLDRLVQRLGDTRRAIGLLRSVHPLTELREAAEGCEQDIARFFTELSIHRDLYERVRAVDPEPLDPVAQRLREHVLRDFHRSGVDRDPGTREEVQRLRRELVELGQRFSRNILNDVRTVELGAGELEGLPEDYVRAHPPGADGSIRITTDYPDYNPFMIYARSGGRREDLYRAFRTRAWPQNEAVLRQILDCRHRLAGLLGYASWADYAAEDKMIGNAERIGEFIDRVRDAAERVSSAQYEQLLARKQRDHPEATEVADWEKAYYEELLRGELFGVDSRALRPYFEFGAVRDGVLRLAERLFGLEFRPAADALRWHEDVHVYDVLEDGERRGRIFLDMHPREGKFKHAAMFPLVEGVRGHSLPQAALVGNVSRASEGGPALLEHDDVVTLFHEFGHLLHHLIGGDVDWAEFSGTGTEWDFVEVPSQLFEEWAWDAGVLRDFAHHHETGEPIPADLVERLRRSRDLGRGLQVRQQMFYARLSLECHVRDPQGLDIDELQRDLQSRYSRFRFVEGTHFHTSFGHLEGYSALYYTYMWSLVIEKDLYSVFRERGLLDRDTARRYRDAILARGGTRDAADLIRDFLGRDYRFDAFERWLEGSETVSPGETVPDAH